MPRYSYMVAYGIPIEFVNFLVFSFLLLLLFDLKHYGFEAKPPNLHNNRFLFQVRSGEDI